VPATPRGSKPFEGIPAAGRVSVRDDSCELVGALEREWRDALCAKNMDK
jgi:hypothetical protein